MATIRAQDVNRMDQQFVELRIQQQESILRTDQKLDGFKDELKEMFQNWAIQ